jgi:hypothetical protein
MDKEHIDAEILRIARRINKERFPGSEGMVIALPFHHSDSWDISPAIMGYISDAVEEKIESDRKFDARQEEEAQDFINELRCRVYDNDGKTVDRFTVVLLDVPWDSDPMTRLALGCSEGGVAYSEFCSAIPGRHLGKRVAFKDLDESTRKHIESRVKDEEPKHPGSTNPLYP